MTRSNSVFSAAAKSDSAFDDLTASLGDMRPHPTEDSLVQLGRALMAELVDLISDTALEDYQTLLCEGLIGAFHSAAGRIERDADRARDTMRQLDRDFDGSEAADVELQEATAKARAGDVATRAAELIRDAAADLYTVATGEVWTAWRGSRRGAHLTAAQLEAKQAIRAIRTRKAKDQDPAGPVIAFRGAPTAASAEDANRIFDALNWAKREWPDMALATTGAKGSEKLAIKWAQQKGVILVLARADFDTHGKAAPFRANDDLIALEPVCCLTLAQSLAGMQEDHRPFGPALNLGQKAMQNGVRHVPIKARSV
jgi:YspA, cpYpsA-related SLOG family